MDRNNIKEISLVKHYKNILNGNEINLYNNRNYILSENQRIINPLNKKVNRKNINNKSNQIRKIESQKINENNKTDCNFKPLFFSTFNLQNKNKYIHQRDKIFNNKTFKNLKKMNIREQYGIMKSEPNLYKSNSINVNKNIILNKNDNIIKDDFSDISEIQKMDYSFDEQNINPDDLFSQENGKLFDEKKVEIKKIMNEYPELIYTEIYKSFSGYQNLKKENIFLKNIIKKLKIEIKNKKKLIDEFTELFNQSKLKFQELILKNKQRIQEIENKNKDKINQLNEKIKKLEEENNTLIKRNKILLSNINKYDKYVKVLEAQYHKVSINTNNNKTNDNQNKLNKKKYSITTRRGSSVTLNSRINRSNNNSKDLKSFFVNKENILDNKNIQNNFKEENLIIKPKKFIYNKTENNLNINNFSKDGLESNLKNDLFGNLTENIKKVYKKDIIRKRENSVRILKANNENSSNLNKKIIN